MASIEKYVQDETISKIYAAYEAMQSTRGRNHLGASLIGGKCKRMLWYSFRWAKAIKHNGQLLRLFQTGHLAESRFIDDLKRVGVKVYDTDETTGNQFTVSEVDGHFGGSMDGVGIGFGNSKKWHVLEFKTHNEKSFTELKDKGVKEAKPQHYAQMCVYMHLTGIERAYYMAVNKNTDELYGERIKADSKHAKELIEKARSIIYAPEPPPGISDRPDWYECKMCNYYDLCHEQAVPQANCRTCAHATPVAGGQWSCAKRDIAPNQTGCVQHIYIPPLITHSKPVDSDGDNVTYEHDGIQWINGPNGFASVDVSKLHPSMLIDRNVTKLKSMGFEIL